MLYVLMSVLFFAIGTALTDRRSQFLGLQQFCLPKKQQKKEKSTKDEGKKATTSNNNQNDSKKENKNEKKAEKKENKKENQKEKKDEEPISIVPSISSEARKQKKTMLINSQNMTELVPICTEPTIVDSRRSKRKLVRMQ